MYIGESVGGNYLDSANTNGNCIITSDGGYFTTDEKI